MRNFEEEYKNYINEECPDLWNRIEPQLKDKDPDISKESVSTGHSKVFFTIRRVMPAVAAIVVLVIGIGVLQTSRYTKDESGAVNATEEVYDEMCEEAAEPMEESASESVEESAAASVEESASESVAESAAESVTESAAASVTEGAPENEYDMNSSEAEYEQTNLQNDGAKEQNSDTKEQSTDFSKEDAATIDIENATLISIEVADGEMKDDGYAYAYKFRLSGDEEIFVYLTSAQCDRLEEEGTEVVRKQKYDLRVKPCTGNDVIGDDAAICVLEHLSKR